jgi:NADH-quinone oxidoreductase subunit N
MSVTVKATAFAALIRLIGLGVGPLDAALQNVLWVLAAMTMIVGNLMAVIQDNVKRLLAYSAIGHAGFLLLGVLTGTPESYGAVVFYLLAYIFMNLGAFAVVVALAQRGQDCERIESFAGLAQARPGLAALMTLFMLSLAASPHRLLHREVPRLLGGGARRLSAHDLAVTTWSPVYYLRIPVLMYVREPGDEARAGISASRSRARRLRAGVVFLGIFPASLLPLVGDLPVSTGPRLMRLLFRAG